jgi:hypothetical protein
MFAVGVELACDHHWDRRVEQFVCKTDFANFVQQACNKNFLNLLVIELELKSDAS